MSSDYTTETIRIVKERGLTKLAEPIQLASGFRSRYFIDGKEALSHGSDLATACRAMIDEIAELGLEFDAVGGLTLGADQFAHGIALLASRDWFVIRKQPKGRGTNRTIEGAKLGPSVRVLLVDDVVTTGGSIQTAYSRVVQAGASVVAATTLVDRGEAAHEFFGRVGVPYRPLMTYSDLGIPQVGSEEIGEPAPASAAV
jgi:orotate phosphoribosyltransferase